MGTEGRGPPLWVFPPRHPPPPPARRRGPPALGPRVGAGAFNRWRGLREQGGGAAGSAQADRALLCVHYAPAISATARTAASISSSVVYQPKEKRTVPWGKVPRARWAAGAQWRPQRVMMP